MTSRRFTLADQIEFASLSHDFNPIHVDPVASRRLIFGQPVVHGVNALLWSLATFARFVNGSINIKSLTCSLNRPVLLNEEVTVDIDSTSHFKPIIRIRQQDYLVAKIKLNYVMSDSCQFEEFPSSDQTELPFSTQPDLIAEEALLDLKGEFTIFFNTAKAIRLFGPQLFSALGSQAIAEIIALTKVVGMHAPGLHSLLTEIQLMPATAFRQSNKLHYKTREYDQRFHQLVITCHSKTFDAILKAFYRPPAVSQAAYSVLKKSVSKVEFALQRALVIGGSRGLGEVTAKYLAAGGAQVLLTYCRGATDAKAIVKDIGLHGGFANAAQFDLTSFYENDLAVMDNFAPTDVYYFATPFIFSGQKDFFSENRLKQFMDFYLLGFHKLVDRFSKCGTNRYFFPSSVAIDEQPEAMGEYCVAKAAAETYCEWVVKNRPKIKIVYPRLPRLATDQTASIAAAENGDTALMLELLRDFSKTK